MSFVRECPKCGREIKYIHEKNFLKGKDKNTICSRCTSEHALSLVKFNPQTERKPKVDLSGKIFGNWEVLNLSHREDKKSHHGIWYWNVKCTNCNILLKRSTSYIKQSKGCVHCDLRLKGETGLNKLWTSYIDSANKRNIPFNLDKVQFKALTSASCYYCGCLPKTVKVRNYKNKKDYDWGSYIFNGIDRINNSLGYVIENCVPCCRTCNRGKGAWSFEYWVSHLREFFYNATLGKVECLKNPAKFTEILDEKSVKRW